MFANNLIELSLIIPTFNEKANISELVKRLEAVLASIRWEVIFVDDDSPDGTAAFVKSIAKYNSKVRCLHRVGRRGLAGACIEGMLASSAPVVAVMDADLQHDEALLTSMYEAINKGAELVVGSRYLNQASLSRGLSPLRRWGSQVVTLVVQKFLGVKCSDPMSGFFMIRREKIDAIGCRLSQDGFKILLDILVFHPDIRMTEVPFMFRKRQEGESKLSFKIVAEYFALVLSKLSGGLLPLRFFMFLFVGSCGVVVHLATLALFLHWTYFLMAQSLATLVAMTSNFALNNQLTFRDRRFIGGRFFIGLLLFYVSCSLGAFSGIGVSTWLFELNVNQFIAGFLGSIVAAVFNYTVSSAITWNFMPKTRPQRAEVVNAVLTDNEPATSGG